MTDGSGWRLMENCMGVAGVAVVAEGATAEV